MRFQDEVIRRVVYAVAMLTGVVLVSMQFGCSRPEANAGFSGFHHASRWSNQASRGSKPTPDKVQVDDRSSQTVSADPKTSLYWTSPRRTSTQSRLANLQPAQPEGELNTFVCF